ncbi:retrovirus-related pol polyprotein from transposon TNT 1-94 [Tanacetum coccineum]
MNVLGPVIISDIEPINSLVPTEVKNTKQESKINELTKLVQMLIDEKVNSSQKTQEFKSNILQTKSSKSDDSSKPIQKPKLKCELCHYTNHSTDDCYRILYCMEYKKEDHRTSDHDMYAASLKRSENYKAQPYQYASPSIQILKAKANPFPPCTHYGFNDHRPDDCRNYLECEICRGYDHFTSRHNRVILVRGGVLAESLVGVRCNTCGSTVHSTTDHNDFDHFKRGEKIQASNARDPTKKMVENQNDIKFKQIRTDNGTEFRNIKLESFCDEKGISQNFSSPYTPEQNGVAERNKITIIEAARTMLNGLILSKHFWTEAVRIACYTQNRSIIDHLEKFDAKADDGYFLGYSFNSKAFSYFNTRRQEINETYHVTFDKSMEAIRFTNNSVVIAPNEQDILHTENVEGPPNLINTEGTQEQNVQNEHIDHQLTKETLGNNTETSVPITEPLVPEVPQSQNTNHASTSSYFVTQDRWSRDQHIKLVNIIGDPYEDMLTRSMATKLTGASASGYLFADFLFEIESKKVSKALKHPGWVDAMQEELNQFYRNKVWTLVPLLYEKIYIGSKWVFRNKKDEHGIVTTNKARLVAQGYSKEEGINYDETFAQVVRMEAIRIFLAFSTYMDFIVFQMDVKSAFLNGKLKEEVYVKQPPGFKSSEFPDYVYKLDKVLYGLKQAPRVWLKCAVLPRKYDVLWLAFKFLSPRSEVRRTSGKVRQFLLQYI